jgi:hypothetical protein
VIKKRELGGGFLGKSERECDIYDAWQTGLHECTPDEEQIELEEFNDEPKRNFT